MDSVISRERQRRWLEDQASRRKRKIRSFIFFIVLFTVIIGSIISVIVAIQQEAESESFSALNQEEKIRVVCDLTPYPLSCFESLRKLQKDMILDSGKVIETTPSSIFTLSLQAALNELKDVISSANKMAISNAKKSKILSALKDCDGLSRDSLRLVNMSMAVMRVIPTDDRIFKISKIRSDLKEWVTNATANIKSCWMRLEDDFKGSKNLKMKMLNAREYVENSSEILAKMDTILDMFNQRLFVGSIIIDNYTFLFHDLGSDITGIFIYCSQYIFLVVLICMVLKS